MKPFITSLVSSKHKKCVHKLFAKYCTNINIKKEKKIDFFFKYITAIHIPCSINVTLI